MSEEPKKKILVVEDDPAIRALVLRALATRYEVSSASDGDMALVEAATFRPDLLLLDVNLPGIDGFGIAMRIRHMDGFKRTPIIFLTARDRPSDTIRGIQVGARHYLTKPFKLDDLLAKVQKALG
jgi:two-component system OmpR family response regulator